MTLEALIFDVDGTLAETEEAHRTAFNAAFVEFGLNEQWPDPTHGWIWTRELYRRLLKVTGGKERIAAFLESGLGVDPAPWGPLIAEIHARKTAIFTRNVSRGVLELRPGVKKTIAWAASHGLRLAIATTTSRPNVDALCLAGFGRPADRVFEVIAAGDEVAAKKPAPDVYALALRRLGLAPEQCLALEDSRNGLVSASAAGLRCLVTPSLYTEGEDFGEADAVCAGLSPEAIQAFGPLANAQASA